MERINFRNLIILNGLPLSKVIYNYHSTGFRSFVIVRFAYFQKISDNCLIFSAFSERGRRLTISIKMYLERHLKTFTDNLVA